MYKETKLLIFVFTILCNFILEGNLVSQVYMDKYLTRVFCNEPNIDLYTLSDSLAFENHIIRLNNDGTISYFYKRRDESIPQCPVGNYHLEWGKWEQMGHQLTI